MGEQYPVLFEDRHVGTVELQALGMYYELDCVCDLPLKCVCRLYCQSGNNWESLGVPVLKDGKFILRKCVPNRMIPRENPRFIVKPDSEKATSELLSVAEDQPFPYLHQLLKLKCTTDGEKTCLTWLHNFDHSDCET